MNSQNDTQSRPRFFNSNKGPDSKNEDKPTPSLDQQKLLSPIKEQEETLTEERKSEVKQEDLREASLQKQMKGNSNLPQYKVEDGEFASFPEIHKKTADKLKARGIVSLFPIQQKCFYPIYNREDVIARDLTGSGKTLAFGLPMVEYLRKNQFLGQKKVQAIVLAPTRELALQVQNELAKIKHYDDEFRTLTVYGGVSIDDQTRELRRGIDIFVGTTGRVLDHIQRCNIDFSSIKTVVLDEADRMLQQGFQEDVEEILRIIKQQCKSDIQICLFSATIPHWVKSVAKMYLKQNYRIVDLAENLHNKTAKNVQHLAINCHQSNIVSALADLLVVYGGDGRAIVFTQTKADANQLILTDKIKQDIEVMHGDIAQNQREVTLKRFREGKFNVLVATDVASRGLDIPNVDLVIQVEPPNEVETYIHRSGRTARAGREGTCITFYDKRNQYMINLIERQAGIKFRMIGVPQPEDVIRASSKVMLKSLESVNKDVLPLFKEAARALVSQSDGDPEKALCKALAYISGHYKHALQSRSLITGQERQITIEMRSLGQKWTNPLKLAAELLHQYFPSNLADNVRGIKPRTDQMGVVFDFPSEQAERFLEIGAHLRETDSAIDFEIVKCQELPPLDTGNDSRSDGAWRSGGGGFQKHGRHQSFGGADFKKNFDDQGWEGASSSFKVKGSSSAYGSRQPSNQKQNRNGGPKSYQNSRKASGFSNNWDQDSNADSETYDYDDKGFNDINIKINHEPAIQKGSQNSQQAKNDGCSKVFIQNLSFTIREEDLRDLFQDHNLKVTKLQILKDGKGNSKGIGFAEFENAKDASTAVNRFNDFELQKRKMRIEFAKSTFSK